MSSSSLAMAAGAVLEAHCDRGWRRVKPLYHLICIAVPVEKVTPSARRIGIGLEHFAVGAALRRLLAGGIA
jgi:hypothetical protein